MEVFSSDISRGVKVKVISFSAFVFFGGLFSVFTYYKLFGGVGFDMAGGYLPLVPGLINLGSMVAAFVVALLLLKVGKLESKFFAFTSLFLLMSVLSQIVIWLDKINDGVFWGGEVLNMLGDEDVVFYSLYYFTTLFVVLFAFVLSILFFAQVLNKKKVCDNMMLFVVLKPLLFAVVGVFVLFYLWN